jgi:F-type H+-transporting ATPase subunit b
MNIDLSTLLLQAINLLVLLALLRWLLYRPLQAVIAARRALIAKELADASDKAAQTEQAASALASQQQALQAEQARLLDAARQEAAAEREQMLASARREAKAQLDAARVQLATERQQATSKLFDEASGLAVDLAGRLLARTPIDDSAFVDSLLSQVAATPKAQRAQWFAPGSTREVQLCTARALTPAAQDTLRARLQSLLGDSVHLTCTHDSALIAGAELRFALGTLALHWARTLQEAGQALAPVAQETP